MNSYMQVNQKEFNDIVYSGKRHIITDKHYLIGDCVYMYVARYISGHTYETNGCFIVVKITYEENYASNKGLSGGFYCYSFKVVKKSKVG